MNKEDANIEQIRDYFAGRLDAKAMHALEKRALEDPFLAEAMEGFHEHPDNVSKDLDDLQARLENRVYKKHFSLKPWLIAASVVLLLGLGTYFVLNNSSKNENESAKTIAKNVTKNKPAKIAADTIKNDSIKNSLAINTPKAIAKNQEIIESKNALGSINKRDNEVAVNARKSYVPASASTPILQNNTLESKVSIAEALQNQMSDFDIQPSDSHQQFQIVDSITGAPIMGASAVAHNNKGFATDNNGYFYLPDSLKNLHLKISALGYESKTVALSNNIIKLQQAKASLNDVVVVGYGVQKKESLTGAVAGISVTKNNPSPANILIRGNAALNHTSPLVLIDGRPDSLTSVSPQDVASISVLKGTEARALYGTRGADGVILVTTKKGDTNSFTFKKSKANVPAAHPQTGWEQFSDYVKTSVKKLDSTGAKGSVILSFSVQPTGRLTGFKIIKGLSDERNQQATDILKNGPLWTYDATSHTGFYTIDF